MGVTSFGRHTRLACNPGSPRDVLIKKVDFDLHMVCFFLLLGCDAKRLQASVESEIKVHRLVRHRNIVQIMAISFLKNAIHLLSKLIKGSNSDDLLQQ